MSAIQFTQRRDGQAKKLIQTYKRVRVKLAGSRFLFELYASSNRLTGNLQPGRRYEDEDVVLEAGEEEA